MPNEDGKLLLLVKELEEKESSRRPSSAVPRWSRAFIGFFGLEWSSVDGWAALAAILFILLVVSGALPRISG
jgi:hypothetical protein